MAESSEPEASAARPTPPASARYLNRELSMLEFHARVLAEAGDRRNALLDRVRFVNRKSVV